MSEPTAWPKKTRERHNHHFDSTIWNNPVVEAQAHRRKSAEYEARAVRELGPECARWLATGEGLD